MVVLLICLFYDAYLGAECMDTEFNPYPLPMLPAPALSGFLYGFFLGRTDRQYWDIFGAEKLHELEELESLLFFGMNISSQ